MNQQNCSNVSYFGQFERYKKGRPHSGKVIRLSIFFYALYVICQFSEIKDDIQVVSQLLCLLGHPVYK